MSARERQRLGWMSRVASREVRLKKAAEGMSVSYRQAKRIWQRYRERGDAGLVHGLRRRVSGRARPAAFRQEVIARYKEAFADFGPTLAAEHLAREGKIVDSETLRRWLLKDGSWQRRRKRRAHRQWRERKEHAGELVQMDGSHHDWFEGRRARAVLMVMVDDATSCTYARFFEQETTAAAFETFHRYTHLYGLALALYVDRDSIYQVEREPDLQEQMRGAPPETQFARALRGLDVKLVFAYSPQAKGRVERTHGTLQDRLIKEMRLAKINTLDAANKFLEEKFLPLFNRRFMVTPLQASDLHRKVAARTLHEALSWEEQRHVHQDWTVQWQNRWLQIAHTEAALQLAGRKITVRQTLDGHLHLIYRGRKLSFRELPERPVKKRPPTTPTAPKKEQREEAFKEKKEYVDGATSPWRNWGVAAGKRFWKRLEKQEPVALNIIASFKKGDISKEHKQGTF